jgi:pyrroloquinoline-quinone synthase
MKISERCAQIVKKNRLLAHPFYEAWTKGLLGKETLASYAEQYYAQVEAFPRFVSSVHSRCPEIAARKVLVENLADEEIHGTDHPSLWMQFAEGLGRTRAQVRAAERLPETRESVETFYDLTAGDWREGLCALYAYESQVPEVSASKIEGLEKFYDVKDATSLAFFRAHMKYDVEHSAKVASILDGCGIASEKAEQATEKACQALLRFLDGVAREHGVTATCAH